MIKKQVVEKKSVISFTTSAKTGLQVDIHYPFLAVNLLQTAAILVSFDYLQCEKLKTGINKNEFAIATEETLPFPVSQQPATHILNAFNNAFLKYM